jgi:transcription elongation factor Elf1
MINSWQEHIRNGGRSCPHCGSTSLTFSSVDGNQLSADIECVKCHEQWQEFFTLTGVRVDGKEYSA